MVEWGDVSEEYQDLIGSTELDSRYLREAGLIPNIVELVGECEGETVLDAGTGTAWLFDFIKPAEAHACDLVRPNPLPAGVTFQLENVEKLGYSDGKFDTVVASLVLIYCSDLRQVLREFHRVAKKRATLVVSLMHPYFYRTGEVLADGKFLLTEDLSSERKFEFNIAESVGPLIYFYRPLPTYFNGIIEAGWRISEVRDWFMDFGKYSEQRRAGVRSNLQRTGKVPLFTFVKATKV